MKNYALARPYAKAAYLFASEAHTLEAWSDFLGKMDHLLNDEAIKNALNHPHFKAQSFISLVIEKLGPHAVPAFRNFLQLLAEKNRLSVLPEIEELFLADMKKGRDHRVVTVKTAFKLTKTALKALETRLSKQFNETIDMAVVEDASLIGGMIIESGDYVEDASLSGQLQRLKQTLTL